MTGYGGTRKDEAWRQIKGGKIRDILGITEFEHKFLLA